MIIFPLNSESSETRLPPTLPDGKFKIIPIIMNEYIDVAMSS